MEAVWEVARTGAAVPLQIKAEVYASSFYALDLVREKLVASMPKARVMHFFRVIQSSGRSAISMRLYSAYNPCARSTRLRAGSFLVVNLNFQYSEKRLFCNSRKALVFVTYSDNIHSTARVGLHYGVATDKGGIHYANDYSQSL